VRQLATEEKSEESLKIAENNNLIYVSQACWNSSRPSQDLGAT
jgi:hypothetical protein